MHKGCQYCFIAAIIDAKHGNENPESELEKAKLLPQTLEIFEGKNVSQKKETKDYHGVFNSEFFENWFKKLLTCLEARNLENTVIIMDNAQYHKAKPANLPRSGAKKADLIAYATAHQIAFTCNNTALVLRGKIKEWADRNVELVVVTLAKESGHMVLYSPPYHSDLQPIELVWAIVKGEVGCQYTVDTTFQDVKGRLVRSFENLKTTTIHGCINKANRHLQTLHKHIEQLDVIEDNNNDNASVDSSDNEVGNAPIENYELSKCEDESDEILSSGNFELKHIFASNIE